MFGDVGSDGVNAADGRSEGDALLMDPGEAVDTGSVFSRVEFPVNGPVVQVLVQLLKILNYLLFVAVGGLIL